MITQGSSLCFPGGEKQMTYIINEECINCGACTPECPTEAIYEGDDIHHIDPEKCIDCGNCAEVCPVGAPNPE